MRNEKDVYESARKYRHGKSPVTSNYTGPVLSYKAGALG